MRLKVKYFVLGLFVLAQTEVLCQNFKSVNKKANEFFLVEDYENALPLYTWMDSVAPGSPELNYKIAFCYLKTSQKAKSLSYLLKSKNAGYEAAGMDFNLGIAYHANSKFDEAIESFNKALSKINMTNVGDKKKVNDIERYKTMCTTALALMLNPLDVIVENLGIAINSPCSEYAPVIASDESILIFTSRRPCTSKNKGKIASIYEDIYLSEKDSSGKWQSAGLMGKDINSPGHDASIALSPSGQTLLIYKDAGNGDIFESERKGNKWTEALRLPSPINSNAWEPSASISADGQTLFFVSNRPGGFGGRDIYVAYKTENGTWKNPQNLGKKINTSLDEDAPFIHPDGKTLYFSSEGHTTMGGFDIFYSSFNSIDSSWSKPSNLGYPINTVDDDLFFVWSADGKRGYYSSEKQGGFGDKDIYMVSLNKPEISLILMKGKISNKNDHRPLKAKIKVTDNADGNLVGTFYSDDTTGKYTLFLIPGRNYGISIEAENCVPFSENIDIQENKYHEIIHDFELNPIERGNIVVLNNVFFESGKSSLKKESFTELLGVAKFMKQHPKIKIEISGYTDDIGQDEVNLVLSENRAKAVVDFLIKNGIPSSNMISKGYGEGNPIATNETEAGRKLNRRTELRIIDK